MVYNSLSPLSFGRFSILQFNGFFLTNGSRIRLNLKDEKYHLVLAPIYNYDSSIIIIIILQIVQAIGSLIFYANIQRTGHAKTRATDLFLFQLAACGSCLVFRF
jgi:hypothetical protein